MKYQLTEEQRRAIIDRAHQRCMNPADLFEISDRIFDYLEKYRTNEGALTALEMMLSGMITNVHLIQHGEV